MKTLITAAAVMALAAAGSAFAEGDLSPANVINVTLEMGSSGDGMKATVTIN